MVEVTVVAVRGPDRPGGGVRHATLDQLGASLTRVRTEVDRLQAETTRHERLSPTARRLENIERNLATARSRQEEINRPSSYRPSPDYLTPYERHRWRDPSPRPRGPSLGR